MISVSTRSIYGTIYTCTWWLSGSLAVQPLGGEGVNWSAFFCWFDGRRRYGDSEAGRLIV